MPPLHSTRMHHRGHQSTDQALFYLVSTAKGHKSKYIKDLGHAAVEQSNADDIINAAMTQGIYDLTLGLSDKERQVLVAGKAHKASAITYGEAKEGAVEAHNFSSKASVTTIHSSNKRKRDARTVACISKNAGQIGV